MQLPSLPLAIALMIAGCAAPAARIHDSPHPGASSAAATRSVPPAASRAPLEDSPFLYQLLTPAALGISRVFDDGRRTYVLFENAVPVGFMVFDENGKPVNFSEGNHAVLIDTVRSGLLLRTPTKSSFAQSRGAQWTARVEVSRGELAEGATFLPAELAAARAELLRAETKLSATSAALDRAAAGDALVSIPSIRADLDEIQTTLDGLNATLVRAHFESGSALLTLSDALKAALIEAAHQASQVRIRGRADATGLPVTNLRIARERALSVRRLLLEGGIEARKLRTSFARADYLASNETPEGRAQNRRVDVLFVAPSPIHVLSEPRGVESLESAVADNRR